MKAQKYSSTDYIFRRGMMVVLFIGGFLITFIQPFYQAVSSNSDKEEYKVFFVLILLIQFINWQLSYTF